MLIVLAFKGTTEELFEKLGSGGLKLDNATLRGLGLMAKEANLTRKELKICCVGDLNNQNIKQNLKNLNINEEDLGKIYVEGHGDIDKEKNEGYAFIDENNPIYATELSQALVNLFNVYKNVDNSEIMVNCCHAASKEIQNNLVNTITTDVGKISNININVSGCQKENIPILSSNNTLGLRMLDPVCSDVMELFKDFVMLAYPYFIEIKTLFRTIQFSEEVQKLNEKDIEVLDKLSWLKQVVINYIACEHAPDVAAELSEQLRILQDKDGNPINDVGRKENRENTLPELTKKLKQFFYLEELNEYITRFAQLTWFDKSKVFDSELGTELKLYNDELDSIDKYLDDIDKALQDVSDIDEQFQKGKLDDIDQQLMKLRIKVDELKLQYSISNVEKNNLEEKRDNNIDIQKRFFATRDSYYKVKDVLDEFNEVYQFIEFINEVSKNQVFENLEFDKFFKNIFLNENNKIGIETGLKELKEKICKKIEEILPKSSITKYQNLLEREINIFQETYQPQIEALKKDIFEVEKRISTISISMTEQLHKEKDKYNEELKERKVRPNKTELEARLIARTKQEDYKELLEKQEFYKKQLDQKSQELEKLTFPRVVVEKLFTENVVRKTNTISIFELDHPDDDTGSGTEFDLGITSSTGQSKEKKDGQSQGSTGGSGDISQTDTNSNVVQSSTIRKKQINRRILLDSTLNHHKLIWVYPMIIQAHC